MKVRETGGVWGSFDEAIRPRGIRSRIAFQEQGSFWQQEAVICIMLKKERKREREKETELPKIGHVSL
jgi:hypothetical protein